MVPFFFAFKKVLTSNCSSYSCKQSTAFVFICIGGVLVKSRRIAQYFNKIFFLPNQFSIKKTILHITNG